MFYLRLGNIEALSLFSFNSNSEKYNFENFFLFEKNTIL